MLKRIVDAWRAAPYWLTGAVIRFVRIAIYGALVALASVLVAYAAGSDVNHAIQVALQGFAAVIATALLAAADKLKRELDLANAHTGASTDPVLNGPAPTPLRE